IPWRSLQELILAHLDVRKRVDIFSLSFYGLVIFPKALGAGEGRFIGCVQLLLACSTVIFGKLIRFPIESSLKVIRH
ncbi:hypothetical protein Gotur_026266, partial [Gossypium turneri]